MTSCCSWVSLTSIKSTITHHSSTFPNPRPSMIIASKVGLLMGDVALCVGRSWLFSIFFQVLMWSPWHSLLKHWVIFLNVDILWVLSECSCGAVSTIHSWTWNMRSGGSYLQMAWMDLTSCMGALYEHKSVWGGSQTANLRPEEPLGCGDVLMHETSNALMMMGLFSNELWSLAALFFFLHFVNRPLLTPGSTKIGVAMRAPDDFYQSTIHTFFMKDT